MAKTHKERDDFEDRFFSAQQHQFDRFEIKLDRNTDIAKEALTEAKLTNSRVTHLEENVNANLKEAHERSSKALERADRVHERLVDMENIIVPNKPPEPEDLPTWWRDPKVITIVSYVALAFLILVAAATRFDLGGIL